MHLGLVATKTESEPFVVLFQLGEYYSPNPVPESQPTKIELPEEIQLSLFHCLHVCMLKFNPKPKTHQ